MFRPDAPSERIDRTLEPASLVVVSRSLFLGAHSDSVSSLIQVYSVLGGIPAYLEQFDPDIDVATNIERHVLSKGAFLYEEPESLLKQELRDPST